MNLFNAKMKDILDLVDVEDTYCYIMGMYIINLLNYDTHIHTSDFLDLTLLCATFVRWNIKLHLHFVPFLHIDMTQVLKIVP